LKAIGGKHTNTEGGEETKMRWKIYYSQRILSKDLQ